MIGDAEWCAECDAGTSIVDESVETSGYEEQQRDWWVVRLACGHETATRVRATVTR